MAIISKIDLTKYFAIFFLSVEEEELTKPEIIADDEVAEEQPAPVLIETSAVFVPESIENTKVVEDIIIAKDLEVEQEVVPLPKDILELQTEQINAGEADNEEKNLIGKFQEESIIEQSISNMAFPRKSYHTTIYVG